MARSGSAITMASAIRIFFLIVMGRRRTTPRILDVSVRILAITIFWPIAAMPAAPTPEATGRVEGRVTFQGAPPPLMTVGETGEAQPTLYIDAAGGLRYAVVYLPDARAAGPPATKPAIVNQRNFIFEPQVLAVRAGRMVRFTSDDVANHNVRAKGTTPVNTFFISTAPGSTGSATHAFGATPPDRPVTAFLRHPPMDGGVDLCVRSRRVRGHGARRPL